MKSQQNNSVINALWSMWQHISSYRKKQFLLLIFLTFLASFAEIISLGSVLPFIGVLTNPETVFNQDWIQPLLIRFKILKPDDLILPLSFVFASLAIIAGILRLTILWVTIWISNATGADLGIKLFNTIINKPYEYHIEQSSNEIITAITQKIGAATSVLISVSSVFTSVILFFSIIGTLLIANTIVALTAGIIFMLFYGLLGFVTSMRLKKNSIDIAKLQNSVVKSLQEGIGGIRDLILNSTHNFFIKNYSNSVTSLRNKQAEIQFINQAPRYLMESLAMVLIAAFVILINDSATGIVEALPLLAIMALGAQRLLPVMQQLYLNWSALMGSYGALKDILLLLDESSYESQLNIKKLEFNKYINLKKVSYKYPNTQEFILDCIDLSIVKGDRIGIIGETGSGKSTLIDILSGLLPPSSGEILIDGNPIINNLPNWRKNIAYVPQSIFLSDGSIYENIAFGIPQAQIIESEVAIAAHQSQVSKFAGSDKRGLQKFVGERGIKLSGGQRQRIGIARALYKKADVIILDEATSALDSFTEKEVIKEINALSKDLTIVMIAHRISTLSGCNKIFEIKNKKVSLVNKSDLI